MDKFYYKLNLIPVGSFYFGGEKKFEPAGEEEANYLVMSRLFPQQTTLLGVLRNALLFGLLKTEEIIGSESELIGDGSFEVVNSWGIIRSLSMLYLEKQGILYREAGLNCQRVDGCFVRYLPAKVKHGIYMDRQELYYWDKYNPKKPFGHYLCPQGNEESGAGLLAYDDIFQACPQPGNRKSRNGKADDKAFYKQTRYRLKPGFSFCLYIRTAQKLKPGECRVRMGGDQSVFKMKVEEVREVPFSFPVQKSGKGLVRLLSDTYLKEVEEENILLSIVEKTDFRFIKTQLRREGYNYGDLNNRGDGSQIPDTRPVLSKKYRLFTKGSVFYCEDVKKLTDAIEAQEIYRRIGYNQYTVENIGDKPIDGLKFWYFYNRYQLEQMKNN